MPGEIKVRHSKSTSVDVELDADPGNVGRPLELRLWRGNGQQWRSDLSETGYGGAGDTPAAAAASQMSALREAADAIEAVLPELEQLELG